MSLTILVNGPQVKRTLNDALAAANGWSGGVTDTDLQALDLASILSPSVRYPSGASAFNTQFSSTSSFYDAADMQGVDADAAVAAVLAARAKLAA